MNKRTKALPSPVKRVLGALGDYQPEGDGYIALCPAHDDSSPSLRISEGDDGRALLTCRAGACETADILKKLGLKPSDLYLPGAARRPTKQAAAPTSRKPTAKAPSVVPLTADDYATAKREAKALFPRSLAFSGYKLVDVYPYRLANGTVWTWRWRFENADGKEIQPFHFDGKAWVSGEPKSPRAGKPLYRLPDALASDGVVFIVEGEKCADALAALGVAATTSGGSSTAKKADWSPLAGRECRIWPDNDDPGDAYAKAVAAALVAQGCSVAMVDVQALGLDAVGDDAADWLALHPGASAAAILALPTIEAEPDDSAPRVQLLRASDIEPKAIDWVWDGWLAQGMLHILAGDGGTGKTTLALTMAAAVTTGGRLPDGTRPAIGNVLIWTGEDPIAEVLVPRLKEAGANLDRVYFVSTIGAGQDRRQFDPSQDMYGLEIEAGKIGSVALVIIDPMVSAVTGDSHKNAEVRRGLQPLVDLAETLKAAVLGITHFAKGTTGRKTTERIIGSVAFTAVSRVAMVTVMGDNGDCRLVRTKSNIGPQGDGFGYTIAVSDQTFAGRNARVSSVAWGQQLFGTADHLLGQLEAKRLPRNEANDWLYALLISGPKQSKVLKAKAAEDGIAWRTVERAKGELCIVAERETLKGKTRGSGEWIWRLPKDGRECGPRD